MKSLALTLTDKNECETLANPCEDRKHSVCQNTHGGFECPCEERYKLNGDQCTDQSGMSSWNTVVKFKYYI